VSLIIELEKGEERDLSLGDSLPVDTDSLQGKKVLVVDDNDMNRLVATTILGNYGTILFEATNGQEAIEMLRNAPVDIILMDIQMPVMSGLEASQVIRREISPDVPIIALTANAIRGENKKCLAAGMNDYLAKPFEEGPFIKMISEWVSRRSVQTDAGTTGTIVDDAGGSAEAPDKVALYDLRRLEAIGQGNADFVGKMIRLFIEQMPVAVRELQAAAAGRQFQTVHEKVHLIKPILHNLSIDSLQEDVKELERLALSGAGTERIDQLVKKIADVVGDVVAGLKAMV
jgi:CheY-like chemotaxis protein